jgi:hypothetical protein
MTAADVDLTQETAYLQGKLTEYLHDGFSLMELCKYVLFAGLYMMDALRETNLPVEAREQMATTLIRDVYTQRDVNICKIPEPFETTIERTMFDNVLPALVDVLGRA